MRFWLFFSLAVFLPCQLSAQVVPNPAGRGARPNLLFITFDTTRADRLGCYGYSGARTPAIDRLAREGVLFSRAYAQAPQTLPSHCSLFTGFYPITHNVLSNGQRLEDDASTLAEMLQAGGYRTGAVVAAAPLMQEFNIHQGFDYYNDDFRDNAVLSGFKAMLRFFSANKLNIPTSRPANRVTAFAKQWLSQHAGRKQKRPFFLWVHYFDPHDPYEFRPDFDKPLLLQDNAEVNQYGYREPNYVNEIEFADHYLGKLLDHLDKLGVSRNTLTVFTTDHGESLGEHEYRGHRQNVYENIIRIPLIFRMPGVLPEGERLDVPGMSIDVTPTILRLLGIPYPTSSFQGTDLFALNAGEPRKIYATAVKLFTKSFIRRTMIYGDLKFIEFDDPERNALYDLRIDPDEKVNLLEGHQKVAGSLSWESEIQQWFEQHENLRLSDFRMSPEQLERLRSLGYIQ